MTNGVGISIGRQSCPDLSGNAVRILIGNAVFFFSALPNTDDGKATLSHFHLRVGDDIDTVYTPGLERPDVFADLDRFRHHGHSDQFAGGIGVVVGGKCCSDLIRHGHTRIAALIAVSDGIFALGVLDDNIRPAVDGIVLAELGIQCGNILIKPLFVSIAGHIKVRHVCVEILVHFRAEGSRRMMVLGRLHLAVEHSVNVDMLRRFDIDVDVMGRFVGLIFAEFRADSGLAVIIKLGCVGCSRTMKLLCLCDRLGLDLTVVNEIAIQSGDLIGVEVPILRVGRLAVHVQFCNNGVALLLPVGVKVRPAVHGLAGHIFRLAFAAPEGELVALAGRGGRVSGKSRALACDGAEQRRYGIIVVLIGFQVFRSVEVDDLLIVVDHALEVRPAVHCDFFQTSRGIVRIRLVIIPIAVVVPAVEVIFSGIVRGVVVANVDRGQVNDLALRLTSEINSLVRIRRVAVAVDHKLDGAQILRFLNFLRIAAVVAGLGYLAALGAISVVGPFAQRSDGKRIVLVTFCIQDAVCAGTAVIIANAAYRDALVMVCLGIDHFAALPDGGVAKVDNGFAFVICVSFSTETEKTRAGFLIHIYPSYGGIARNIQNILELAHIAVVDVQHGL